MWMKNFKKLFPKLKNVRHTCASCPPCCAQQPYHLICFKQWTPAMVLEIILSAINLKCQYRDTHCTKLNALKGGKIMIMLDSNEPALSMAVSKAASFLGANDTCIVDHLVWEKDYYGRVFSEMADAIFIATNTHMCMQRFANCSIVPVLCMKSRTHATIQSLSTVMTIIQELGDMKGLNIAYLGKAHPILNSLLLLCPMLHANIRYMCCCKDVKVTPLLYDASKTLVQQTHTVCAACETKQEALANATVVISGPASDKPDFKITLADIRRFTRCKFLFIHTLPRGPEVQDKLFYCNEARTFVTFQNMQYIAAALMYRAITGRVFG